MYIPLDCLKKVIKIISYRRKIWIFIPLLSKIMDIIGSIFRKICINNLKFSNILNIVIILLQFEV